MGVVVQQDLLCHSSPPHPWFRSWMWALAIVILWDFYSKDRKKRIALALALALALQRASKNIYADQVGAWVRDVLVTKPTGQHKGIGTSGLLTCDWHVVTLSQHGYTGTFWIRRNNLGLISILVLTLNLESVSLYFSSFPIKFWVGILKLVSSCCFLTFPHVLCF